MEIIHGVPCIKGEIHSLITLMRLNTRWSSRNSTRRAGREASLCIEEDQHIQNFRKLNEYLEGLFDLQGVDCVNYIQPFHDVIVSPEANGPLTSAALSALGKFALYGFFNSKFPNIKAAMSLVANCIAHCEFEETDWESDELILMKLLELSALCFRCNAADELTVHSAWEIYCTCISIHNHYRASKILKSEAETALVHLTLSIFNRASLLTTKLKALSMLAPSHSGDLEITVGEYTEGTLVSSQTGIVVMLLKVMRVLAEMLETPKQTTEHIKFALFLINVALEAGGTALSYIPSVVTLLSDDICRHLLRSSQSDDLGVFSSSLRVVFNLFMSIKDHMKVQLEVFLSSVHLRLLGTSNVASPAKEELVLESLLDFCREPSLMQDIYANYDCDVQCSNLFDIIIETLCKKVLMHIEDIVIDAGTNENANKSVSKVQLIAKMQDGLIAPKRLSIIHRLTYDGIIAVLHAVVGKFDLLHYSEQSSLYPLDQADSGDDNVESQVDKWCETSSEPEFMSVDDYELLHYVPPSSPKSLPTIDVQTSRASSPYLLIRNVSDNHSSTSNDEVEGSGSSLVDKENELTGAMLEARQKAIEALRQRKMMKQKLRWVVEEFNQRPVKPEWLKYAVDAGIISSVKSDDNLARSNSKSNSNNTNIDIYSLADPHAVAIFLKNTTSLGKAQIGEFISKGPVHLYPFNQKVLKEYLATFDFKGELSAFDKALRLFLSAFRLPGEAQCIDRIMEAFAAQYYLQLGQESPFASADAAYILSFSTIMLNTDLHNPQIVASKRMTKDEFIRNNRGINDGKDLPKEYLSSLYDEIKAKQIQVDIDISDPKATAQVDVTDPTVWNKLIHKQKFSSPPSFTPTTAARKQMLLSSTNHSLYYPFHLANLKKPDSYFLTTYEEDMFFTMCKPIYEAIGKLWEQTLDDIWINRLLQGILQMLAACVKLKLHRLYCRIWRSFMLKACQWMSRSRSMTTKPFARTNLLASRNSYEQWKGDSGHDLLCLSLLPSEALISSSVASLSISPTCDIDSTNKLKREKIDYTEIAMIKSEVTIKLLLEAIMQTPHLMDSMTYLVLYITLLWCRSRGALPLSMAMLNAEYSIYEESKRNGNGIVCLKIRFPPSIAMHNCLVGASDSATETSLYYVLSDTEESANEEQPQMDDNISKKVIFSSPNTLNKSNRYVDVAAVSKAELSQTSQNSSGSWIMGFGSLIWSNNSSDPSVPTADCTNISQEYKHEKRVGKLETIRCNKTASINTNNLLALDKQGYAMRPDDMVLSTTLSQIDKLSILCKGKNVNTIEVATEGLLILFKHLVRRLVPSIPSSCLDSLLNYVDQSPMNRMLRAANEIQGEQELLTGLGVEKSVDEIGLAILQDCHELDLLLCLEWISDKLYASGDPSNKAVPKILKWILSDEIDTIITTLPTLVDRSIFLAYKGLLQNVQSKDSQSIWWELIVHIVHLPMDTLIVHGSMIVGGVFSILQSIHSQPGCSPITSDQWYSLLSITLFLLTEGPISDKQTYKEIRTMIWQMMVYIFTEDIICAENYEIIKKVVYKLLHRYLLHSRKRRQENMYQDEHIALEAIKEIMCVEYAYKLCLHAYSEFVYSATHNAMQSNPNHSLYTTPSKLRLKNTQATSPRSPKSPQSPAGGRDVAVNLFQSTPTGEKHEMKTVSFPLPIPSHPPSNKVLEPVKVKVLHIMNSEEASRLYLETICILADLCYIESMRVIEACLQGIEQLVGIEPAIHLPAETMLSVVEELVNRLPQNIVTYTGRQQQCLSHAEIVTVCLRGCNILCTLFTRYTRVLVHLPHYSSLYIRAMSALVTNASVSPRLQAMHEEMMAMAIAMLKLLRIPSQVDYDRSKTNENHTTERPAQSPAKPTGGFSLWGLLGFNNAPSTADNSSPQALSGSSVVETVGQDVVRSSQLGHDRELVCLAWKTASSLYSLFPGLVKGKEAHLYAAVVQCIEFPPVDLRAVQSPVKMLLSGALQSPTVGESTGKRNGRSSPSPLPLRPISASKVQIV